MSIRCLIVDDEEPGRVNLRLALGVHAGWKVIGECASAAAARTLLAAQEADVLFLDIRMPGESGLALARDVSSLPAPPLLIFVTAYSEHAVEAFDVHALDYLLKPLDDARLAQAVERAAAMLAHRQKAAYGAALRDFLQPAQQPRHVNVRSVGRIEQILIDDILWIEAAGNYVELHLARRTVLHRITLNRIETQLDPAAFLRVHRGAIVRRDQIASLATTGDGSYRLALRCGGAVAVSERYLPLVKAAM